MKTAVILPTWSRVQQAVQCVHRLLDTSAADVVIVTEDDLTPFIDIQLRRGRVFFVMTTPRMTAVQKWNCGLEMYPDYKAYVLGADDVWAHENWYNEVLSVRMETGAGFIGINDGRSDGSIMSTHYFMTREFIVQHHGGVMAIPHYRSWGLDEEATIRAKRANQFAYAERAVLEHRHWVWGKAEQDESYKRARPAHDYDIMICKMRESRGFPDDFEAVIR